MCTAISYQTRDHYFGRNFDLEFSYQETVTVTPRNFPFSFRRAGRLASHYGMIGMAYVKDDYPLYYDAVNEKGLAMAGLNFPGNAVYQPEVKGKDNIAPFELILWILGQCADIAEAKELLKRLNLVKIPFSQELLLSPLHWMLADRTGCLVVEPMSDGLRIYENPIGVLTNNPPFAFHRLNLSNYMNLSNQQIENRLECCMEKCAGDNEPVLSTYSRGMGAMGLPGDLSSASRFVKAAFTRLYSVSGETEHESVNQFFHILSSVEQQRGCVEMGKNLYETTIYSSCCNTEKGIYYYRTYENSRIIGVDMHGEDLEGQCLTSYPLQKEAEFMIQNRSY